MMQPRKIIIGSDTVANYLENAAKQFEKTDTLEVSSIGRNKDTARMLCDLLKAFGIREHSRRFENITGISGKDKLEAMIIVMKRD